MGDYDTLEISAVNDEVTVENDTPGKGTCPDCGKVLTITAAGNLRKHQCVNDVSTGEVTPKGGTGAKVKRPRTPSSVRNLSVAIIASTVEYGAAASVSRWADCQPSEVPADLGPNADIMIGPILDAIWPRLPRRAQRMIKNIADESDLLVAAMAWWEYGTTLKKWGEARASKNEVKPTRGYQDGIKVSEQVNGDDGDPYRSFAPNPAGVPFM